MTPSSDIAFTPTVKALQIERGSRAAYAKMEERGGFRTQITADLAAFLSGTAQASKFALSRILDQTLRNALMSRPPLPPFTDETAAQKARGAEDAWNSRDPARVALAYTPDSQWRNRAEFLTGREAIAAFLTRKWTRERDYRLIKEVWVHAGNRVAVRFAYEYHDDNGNWHRAHGNENWQFDAAGLMKRRLASINEHPIAEADRLFHWPLGRRPGDHPGLSDLGL